MASPTRGEIETQISNAVKILAETQKFGAVNTPNFLALFDTYAQDLETEFPDDATSALADFRSGLAGLLNQGPGLLGWGIREYGRFIEAPETSPGAILTRVYDYMVANSLAVTSRQFTFQAPVASGANIGTGVINRLNKDEWNFDIENQTPDQKNAICTQDQFSGGVIHEETLEFRSTTAERDNIRVVGSGLVATIRALSARNSRLRNSSFTASTNTGYVSGVSIPTELTGWTVAAGSISDLKMTRVAGEYYRGFSGDVPTAIRVEGNVTLSQDFTVNNIQINADIPYYCQVAFNKTPGGASGGTLTLKMGAASGTVNLAGAPAGWNVLRIPLGSLNWYRNFNTTDPAVVLEVTGLAGPYLLLDDVIMAQFTPFDSSWYAVVGGETPFRYADRFDWSDVASGSTLQDWFWRSFNAYLPHATGGGVTWPDP